MAARCKPIRVKHLRRRVDTNVSTPKSNVCCFCNLGKAQVQSRRWPWAQLCARRTRGWRYSTCKLSMSRMAAQWWRTHTNVYTIHTTSARRVQGKFPCHSRGSSRSESRRVARKPLCRVTPGPIRRAPQALNMGSSIHCFTVHRILPANRQRAGAENGRSSPVCQNQ